MAAFAYLRVSTDEQATSGLGLEAQRAACEAAAVRLGVPLVRVFTDAGASGKTPIDKRPALGDALAALKRGDVLLVAKRDRLARDVLVALVVERALATRKARLVSAAGEGSDDDGPAGVLLRRVLDAVSEFERLTIAARTKAALRAKQARGERCGAVLYGYQLAGNGRHLEFNAHEQRALTAMRAWRASGLSVRAVVAQLAAHGYRTRKGTAWQVSHVHRLLARPVGAVEAAA